jgi:hypothetical protein
MSVKLALLKSGEHIIADIMELVNEEEKVVSLIFSNPYVVQLLTPELLMENSLGLDGEVEHKVSFYPWIVLSQDKKIAVDPKWVVTVVNPHEWIKKSYEEKMLGKSEENLTGNSMGDVWANIPTVDDEEGSNNITLLENFEVITEEKDG